MILLMGFFHFLFNAVVGVRADGFAAEQSPTTQYTVLANMLSLLLFLIMVMG